MKMLAKIISMTLVFILMFSSACIADNGGNWYIIKNGSKIPGFPKDCEFLSTHGCFYADLESYNNGEKVIYLTFDAGYENGNIEKILDTLKKENVTGAFFVLGNLIKKNTDLVKRMATEGHVICNHTINHKDMTKMSKEEISANVAALEDLCYENTGYVMPKYFRYPEGHYNRETVLVFEELGYKTFFWSMSHADWDNARQPDAAKALASLKRNTHPGAIILLHPTSATNADILPELISWWKSEGYSFGTLDELVERTTSRA